MVYDHLEHGFMNMIEDEWIADVGAKWVMSRLIV